MSVTKNHRPRVTVLLPVYNAESFVKSAIESILNQSFKDFELLIINDGSTDKSLNAISKIIDPRIRLINNEKNIGLIATLNKGLDLADSELIARMDNDDLALVNRLAKQVEAFDADADLIACGTNYYSRRGWLKSFNPSEFDGDELKAQLLFTTCFNHPTIMMKNPKKHLDIKFETDFIHCEDYRLWTQLALKGKFRILPEPLLIYRIHQQQTTAKYRQQQFETSVKIRKDYIQRLGFTLNEEQELYLNRIGDNSKWGAEEELLKIDSLLKTILDQNRTLHVLNTKDLKKVFRKNWLDCCGNTSIGWQAYRICLRSDILAGHAPNLKERMLLLFKCGWRKIR